MFIGGRLRGESTGYQRFSAGRMDPRSLFGKGKEQLAAVFITWY